MFCVCVFIDGRLFMILKKFVIWLGPYSLFCGCRCVVPDELSLSSFKGTGKASVPGPGSLTSSLDIWPLGSLFSQMGALVWPQDQN